MSYREMAQEERLDLIESEGGNWLDGTHTLRNVREMDYTHLVALLAWFERQAPAFYARRLARLVSMNFAGMPAMKSALDASVKDHLDKGSFSWMVNSPLWAAVSAEIEHREKLAVTKGRVERKRKASE